MDTGIHYFQAMTKFNSNPDQANQLLSLIEEDAVISLAKDLIRIPSPTEDEKLVADYISTLLRKEHFEVALQEVSHGRPQVIARLPGSGNGRSLMFNGHMDNDSITK